MNPPYFLRIFFYLSIIQTVTSCGLINSDGNCDGNEMKQTEEPVIYLKVNYADLPASDSYYNPRSSNAALVKLKGSIQKIYCDGKESSKFTYGLGFDIEGTDPDHTGRIFDWTEPYQFKFSNKNDLVRVMLDLVFEFKDGTHWETMETYVWDYRFSDLKFDVNSFQYYVEAVFGSDNKLIKVN